MTFKTPVFIEQLEVTEAAKVGSFHCILQEGKYLAGEGWGLISDWLRFYDCFTGECFLLK